jgi:hypothetical protein
VSVLLSDGVEVGLGILSCRILPVGYSSESCFCMPHISNQFRCSSSFILMSAMVLVTPS